MALAGHLIQHLMARTAPRAGTARGAQRFDGAGPLHDGEAYTAIRNTFAATYDHGLVLRVSLNTARVKNKFLTVT